MNEWIDGWMSELMDGCEERVDVLNGCCEN